MRTIVSCLIISLLVMGSCEAQEVENLMTNKDQREMLRLINQVRQNGVRCGGKYFKAVKPLKWDDKLEKAASDKSLDMYKNDYFDHTSPGGENLADRLKKVDYSWQTIGENIAMGQTSVKQVVDTWVKSDGHCRNIMKAQFTHMGVSQYGVYWTQVFAKPLE